MEAASLAKAETDPLPVNAKQCMSKEEIKKAINARLDESRGQPPETRYARIIFKELEEKQNSPLAPEMKRHANWCIVQWLKKNKPPPKSDLEGLMEEAMKTPADASTKFKYRLSPELAKVLGPEVLSGHVVMKMMISIVNQECKRDKRNSLKAITSERLMPIFNTPKFNVHEMAPFLRPHLHPL